MDDDLREDDDDQAVQDDPEDEDFAVDGGGQSSGEEAEEDEASFRSDESESDDSEDEDFIAGGRARKRNAAQAQQAKKTTKAQAQQSMPRLTPARAGRAKTEDMKEEQHASELGLDEEDESGDSQSGEGDSDVGSSQEKKAKHGKDCFAMAQVPLPDQSDGGRIERVLKHRELNKDSASDRWRNVEFLVKWAGLSHLHNTWERLDKLEQLNGYLRVKNYMKKVEENDKRRAQMTPEEREAQDIEYQMEEEILQQCQEVDRIVTEHECEDGVPRFLVKWRGLPYEEATWERLEPPFSELQSANKEIANFKDREERLQRMQSKSVEGQRRAFKQSGALFSQQPEFLQGGELRDYQLEGLNWLIHSWKENNNCILADEMGLGKTVQCAGMLGWLHKFQSIRGPFLVVVPLSTIPNWSRELTKWVPFLNTVLYVGSNESRQIIRNYEFFESGPRGTQPRVRFDVLVTTYEVLLKDAKLMQSISWNYVIVDEAHRLKNAEGAFHREMKQLQAANKLLVTGTPLQNNLRELWALLNFLEPNKFPDCEEFESRHKANIESREGLGTLHSELKPHLLRRTVKDVEKSLPPKRERVLRMSMSPLQRQYYKWILSRNVDALNKGAKGSGQVTLLNIVVELKKCCNHPFLFESAEYNYGDSQGVESLIRSSGKVALLDKLLTRFAGHMQHRLKEQGHRCLIFSQMVRMLDILADYLRGRGFKFQRLDGSSPPHVRHHAVDHFNSPGSDDFCFILSTRAGGLGVNLATADTVIIFDSDWNPQNDLQAMSRAHRIGQTETVNIYRFVTKDSVEEDILERAKRKMVLDHLVIQGMDTSGRAVVGKNEQKKKNMFSSDELSAVLRFGTEELFKQNDEDEESGVGGSKNELCTDEDLDNILARADQDVPEESGGTADNLFNQFKVASFDQAEDDATFWSRLLGTNATSQEDHKSENAAEDSQELMLRQARMQQSKSNQRQGITPLENALVRVTHWPGKNVALNRRDASRFAKMARCFHADRVDDMALEVQGKLADVSWKDVKDLYDCLIASCRKVLDEAATKGLEQKEQVVDFFGSSVKAQELVARAEELNELAKRARQFEDSPQSFLLDHQARMRPPAWAKQVAWGHHDDSVLLFGVYRHGFGNWQKIAGDKDLGLGGKIKTEENGEGVRPEQIEMRANQQLKRLREAAKGGKQGEKVGAAAHEEGQKKKRKKKEESNDHGKKKRKAEVEPKNKDGKSKDEAAASKEARETGAKKKEQREFSSHQRAYTDEELQQAMDKVQDHIEGMRTLRAGTQSSMTKEQVVAKSKEHIYALGQHVDSVMAQHNQLGGDHEKGQTLCWRSLAERIGNCSGDYLRKCYQKLSSGSKR